jgi:tetratricopeptide (TPR) repeat protein
MMKYLFILIAGIFLTLSCASQIRIPNSTKTPVETSDLERSKINEGIRLHDQGQYQEAIKLYEEALVANPDNVWALYEIAFSYSQMGNNDLSLDYALRALEYNSHLIGEISILAANILDNTGKPKQALELYQKAVTYQPDNHMLYYNMGVTYYGLEKLDEAQANFIKALELNQTHASSHLALAQVYMDKGEQIPSILLLYRFLILEPKTQRSATAINYLNNVLAAGVERKDDKNVNINIFGLTKGGDSQFHTIEVFYKLSRATRYVEKNEGKSEVAYRLLELNSLLAFMKKDELSENTPFIEKYLISYFADLNEADFTDCCLYYTHQLVENDEIQQWLKENWPKVREFEKWDKEYELSI